LPFACGFHATPRTRRRTFNMKFRLAEVIECTRLEQG
jgi:hypothetical protein